MSGTGDSTVAELLARQYAAALHAYVTAGDEAALTSAYELGRSAASGGLGVLDLAITHHEALRALPAEGAGGRAPLALAGQFLVESLSPFEMTLRSYRANARLLGLSEVLAEQNAEIDRAREQLRTILDATTAVIYLKDAEGRYLFVNRQFQEVFGLRREEVLGKRDEDVLPAPIAEVLHHDDDEVLAARAPLELEEFIPVPSGPHAYLSLKFPLLDTGGAPYGLCCVATDITERKRAEEAVRRARAAADRERQLKRALEARDRFLDIASHELKTPLTSLELQVASLRRMARSSPAVPVSEERVQSKCEVISRQVDRLKVLINGLIDVGRITASEVELSREPVDLAEVVRAGVARVNEALARSGSQVTLRSAAPIVGTWDRSQLDAMVNHLLTNAIKFGEGRHIEITVDALDRHAVLRVRDHGIGIDAADQRRIFGRFERAVSERHYGGFGLGLWVAQQVADAHGGSIRVESRPGDGAEFTVELPLQPA